MSTQPRRCRLEIAVKRLHGLVNMSSSARVVFAVRFSSFPEIFIRPQIGGGGGVVERAPAGDRILSLTYNVCHKAEFYLSDDEYRRIFPAQCVCRVYDEGQQQASLSWLCPCPLSTAPAAEARQHSNYAMCDGAGKTMGFAEMSCRVVPAEEAMLPTAVVPGATATSVVSRQLSSPVATSKLTVNGKPYLIRVVLDGAGGHKRSKRSHKMKQGGHRGSSPAKPATSGAGVVVDGTLPQKEAEKSSQGRPLEAADAHGRRRSTSPAKKKTLLHVLQYDVAYQIQSNCGTLYATLKREFAPLDAVAVNEKSKPMTDKLDCVVQRILKSANIVIQLANQIAESSGTDYTDASVEGNGRRNPVNKLPLPREGSVAHFLTYNVLFQLQCLGTSLCHLTSAYRQPLKVRLSTLHRQHLKYIKHLCVEIQELTKCINIIVQSTIDRSFAGGDAFSKLSASAYSSDFTSSVSSTSIAPSRSSSGGRSSVQRSSTVESVSSASVSGTKVLNKPLPTLTNATSRPAVQLNANEQPSSAPPPQGFSVATPFPLSSVDNNRRPVPATLDPRYSFPPTTELRTGPLPSKPPTLTPSTDGIAANRPPVSGITTNALYLPTAALPTSSRPAYSDTGASGAVTGVQRQSSVQGGGDVPVPVPQSTSSSVGDASGAVTGVQRQSSVQGGGGVPVPVPQSTSSSVGNA
ncbi:uncharacterized protein Tco025E_01428, partial [Trypanosoma conorhini]